MKKKSRIKRCLPTIIFLVLLSAVSAAFVFLFQQYGLGMTVVALGILLIAAGLFSFIFFLSIDPGYGWSKGKNLNGNYIFISVAVIVCLMGAGVYCLGKEIHETAYKYKNEELRCQDMLTGQVEQVVKSEWYQLKDKNAEKDLKAYLFKKRGSSQKYKVIVVNSSDNVTQKVRQVKISSNAIGESVVVKGKKGICSEVFECELNINGHYVAKQNQEPDLDLDVTATLYDTGESCDPESRNLHMLLSQ